MRPTRSGEWARCFWIVSVPLAGCGQAEVSAGVLIVDREAQARREGCGVLGLLCQAAFLCRCVVAGHQRVHMSYLQLAACMHKLGLFLL